MFLYQYILLAGFSCLLLNRKTRFAAATFLLGWVFYIVTTIGVDETRYYAMSAVIETTIAIVLNRNYRYVAYLGYSLILLNIYGLSVHTNTDGKNNYIVIYAVVSITQFILITSRLIPDGICRILNQRFFIRNINYDCRKTCVKVYKTTAANSEQK